MTKRIAIIPARGGSKRIPSKNIKPFLNKAIIAYSIEAAINSKLFTEVMVSTDSQQIASIARQYGANVPFFRSAQNATDYAGTAEVLCEVIDDYRMKMTQQFEEACCIYPTAPFVSPSLLIDSYSIFTKFNYDVVFPILRYSYPIQRSLKRWPEGRVEMFWPENYHKRSQDLEPAFHDAGQFYWFKVDYMKANSKLFSNNSYGYEIDELHGQDIDTLTDWRLAELKYQLNLEAQK